MIFIKEHLKKIIGVIVVLVGITGIIVINYLYEEPQSAIAESNELELVDLTTTTSEEGKKSIFIDIKGAVKKPGVYETDENSKVIDAITLAGGLKSNADTSNINLSQHLKDEMVIYIFTENELKKSDEKIACDTTCKTEVIEVNNCTEKTSSVNNEKNDKLININTASKEELMSLSGIGEAKADAIIAYRNEKQFATIEDIMEVSGIGEAVFATIKDSITV